MSEFENTNLPFLEKDCIETFGKERGKKYSVKRLKFTESLPVKATTAITMQSSII